ncbi:L-threonine 3-dehydrogenase [Streptomyces acidiscabies]|uniref:L-threonine 3-dehydrogenase n=1 Tax=Streptomyces acidiscabies TaxID=42234 RepID=A0AAP6BAI0_9ACTN|nr:L-threonine 3-dehydrogenase [Streptomyces acidiscabies]MBP5935555.1 L-threonine 3-dehydrogenase [Streptomyces sp. LBUM 1476]MBZ3916567.1 L-threonine 3-dehydrogenase [Streptomyces acidiscabies]MDX2961058.1 L-threonine 3-dehydrogenase [Streptomyces acidiscabies]MDX3020245.1 L-threonine 3-dehydrogenase [Streptomyces acidiscabies]MDX3791765.1 L-threonine 3-dehydrogenase [Streptomyces acidiscabies]
MKALVKEKAEPGLWLRDVPEPAVGAGDVLIKVQRTGICGTDLHIRSWDGWARQSIRTPLVVGHEFVGEVVEVGAAVTDVAIGDRVSGEGHLVCGKCRNCLAGRRHLCRATVGLGVGRDGAFAEYVALPASNVWVHRVPVDLDVAAIFDPFGNAVHTALSFPLVGEDVLITGAGPIGLMAAAVARHAGARNVVITDVSEERLDLARKVGVSLALNVARSKIADGQRELGLREGFDVGLEMSGRPEALRDMIANMTHGGRIAMLGLPTEEFPVDWSRIVTSMITLKGIYGREMFETWYAMSVLLEGGLDLAPVITGRYGYRDFDAAFADAASGRGGKVILDWTT